MWQWNRRKDEAFYENICYKYYERIYLYCLRMVKGQEDLLDLVEECTQNTFLEARKQIAKLVNHPNVEGWLYTTARNLVNNSFRRMYIRNKYEISMDDHISEAWAQANDELEELFSGAVDLDKLCEEVLEGLQANEYELYCDYFRNKMSVYDLAGKHEVSATAMTTRIYRLKKKIKKSICAHLEK
ncbi:RNA polymerase sigma factor [Desulfosporosinus nitroreducens]|uniref:Sigma-70 family RNA polymerase sigma factor n=1 Tax=Desulfosporosinus nitroreducens TaxID=2018668 RepID=A0ABT8QRI3_9FIRM|nr:sigma-70 family RNA polymerase sigma factor [Desulfosporosinus nitroreducens]MDO0823910.1 sigma-70 family RNA polymerase sigma factor [Desulfosporosinus nitroreducens]